jgi:hypothetical protein
VTVVTITLAVEVNDPRWAAVYGAPEEASRLLLFRDVEDYVIAQVWQSAAADEGAIVDVDLIHTEAKR